MSVFHRQHLLRDQSGAISVIGALSIMMLLAIAAIVIDTGSLYFARRNLQSTNDAAALAAVQDPANASAVAAAVFARNGYADEILAVTTGVYTADESLTASDRFVTGGADVNAVRVGAMVQQHDYFASLFGLGNLFTLKTQATAARVPTATFGAGTRLAELNSGVINGLLGRLWGSSLSLSLVDYQSLMTTNVDALTFFDQLATDISVTGSYQQLASVQVTVGQILDALIETTNAPGGASGTATGALLALQSLRLQLDNSTPMLLSDVIDLSSLEGRTIGSIPPNGEDAGQQLNLMGLLSASARTAGGGQITNLGTTVTIPAPGSSVSARLAIGAQMAQVAAAKVGVSIRTAPIRLAVVVTLTNINLGVATATIQVPIYLEAEAGQATLLAMPCMVGGRLAVIAAASGATSVQFGTVSDAALKDFSTPVTPVSVPIVNTSLLGIPIQVNISGSVGTSGSKPQTLSFTQADIDSGTVKSVSGTSIAPYDDLSANIELSTTMLGNPGLLGSLPNSQLSGLTAALNPVATNLVGQLDAPVNSALTALGLQLGIADVRVFDASCRAPTLVG